MSREDQPRSTDRKQYVFNLTLAAVAGQVGCLTLAIIFLALVGGLLLDKYLNTKPLFTLLLMIGSVPITIALMFWIVRAAISKIKPSSSTKEDTKIEN